MGITTRARVRSSQLGELLKTPGLFPHRRRAETGTELAANDGNYTPPPGFPVLSLLSYSLIKTGFHLRDQKDNIRAKVKLVYSETSFH